MSRRPYPTADFYEERERDFYSRPRQERDYDELDVDIRDVRTAAPRSRAPPAETIVSDRRTERIETGPRRPDFLREDYGQSTAGPLVVRERRVEDDYYSRPPARTRRASLESMRSRPPVEKKEEEIDIRIREREGGSIAPSRRYPKSEFREDETVYRSRAPSRAPPREERTSNEEIDIRIRKEEGERAPPPRPRTEFKEREIEEITFRRGPGDRPRPPPPRTEIEEKDIDIRIRDREQSRGPRRSTFEEDDINIRIRDREQSRGPAPSRRGKVEEDDIDIRIREREREGRGRETSKEDIDIRIRERSSSRPAPRPRSLSRGTLVRREEEEWIVRRKKTRSPTPPPPPPSPPREYEKEEIIIRRRRERTPSPEPEPEPPRVPTPSPSPPPLDPIYERPIIREVITHHRHIDHGVERARSPTPPRELTPPPPPPSPPKEDNLEIEIKRSGVRNGKAFEEDIIIDRNERSASRSRSRSRAPTRAASVAASVREREVVRRTSPSRSRYAEDDVSAEADFYMRRAASRGYAGEAYNGATKDWGLVDIPPGTERVQMDGVGGGRQEITWQRYNGERSSKFRTGDRVYERPNWDREYSPLPRQIAPPPPPSIPPAPPSVREEKKEEIDIRITRNEREEAPPAKVERKKDKMWTEITKDLVIKEAVDEMGYSYEETDQFFYVIEYLRYEDVLKLVELTEDIRRERRDRLREIQWEREERERLPKLLPPPAPIPPPPMSDHHHRSSSRWGEEKIYEREYYRDRDGRRYRLSGNRRVRTEEEEEVSLRAARGSWEAESFVPPFKQLRPTRQR